jgi:isoleucyl-tRNA synthetase
MKEGEMQAFATTLYVLRELSKTIAPFAPFIAEHLWQELRREGDTESVHLENWVETKSVGLLSKILNFKIKYSDSDAVDEMRQVREIVTKALELRDQAKIKVRQPLALLTVPSNSVPDEYLPIIAEELNVKKVEKRGDEVVLDTAITDELRDEGVVRDAIRLVQDARKAANLKPGEQGSVSITVNAEQRMVVEKHLKDIETETTTTVTLN